MVKNDLIDRYIYAVTKHMKSAMKKDVAAELYQSCSNGTGNPE